MARLSLARFGTSRPAFALRTAPAVLIVATASVTVALRPDFAVTRLAGAIGIVAVVGIFQPREPVPTLSLVMLIIDYAVATRSLSASARIVSSLFELAALYAIHCCFAVAVGVRFAARIDRSVPRVMARRLLQTLSVAVPIAAGSAAIGGHSPRLLWLGLLGVLAGLGLAALPFIALRRH